VDQQPEEVQHDRNETSNDAPRQSAEEDFDSDFWFHEIPELPKVQLKHKSLCWNPGRLVVVKREPFPSGCAMMCAVPGAILLTIVLLIVREQVLGGPGTWPAFLTSAGVCLVVGGLLIYRRMRGSKQETTLDWESQTVQSRQGRSRGECSFQQIKQIAVRPVARPNYFRSKLEIEYNDRTETLLETDPPEDEALIPCRQLAPAADRIARALSVPMVVEIDGKAVDHSLALDGAPPVEKVAARYEKLGDRRRMEMRSADYEGDTDLAAAKKQQATSYYMEAARLNPARSEPLLELAKLSENDARVAQAIELAVERKPEDPQPLMERGWRSALADRYEDALADYTAAIRLQPSVRAYHGRADVYVMQDQYSPAIDDFTKALELEPDNPQCYHQRASCLREWYRESGQQDHLNRALSDLDVANRLEPDEDSHLTERCALLKDAGRFEEAISGLTDLIRRDDSSSYLYTLRGQAYFDNKQFRLAIRDFTSSIEVLENQRRPGDESLQRMQDESLGYSFRWRSEAYRELGENIEADRDAQRFNELVD
jgi:tetratricopeptide (TPR) repeat protein